MEVKRCGMSPAFGMNTGFNKKGKIALSQLEETSKSLVTALQGGWTNSNYNLQSKLEKL